MSNVLKGIIAAVVAVAVAAVAVFYLHGRTPTAPDEATQGANIPAVERDAYIASAIPSCKSRASSDQRVIDARITAEAIEGYCRCVAERSADTISIGEMNAIAGGKPLSDSFAAKLQDITKTCGEQNLTPAK